MRRARILIADDHEIFRRGVRSLLASCPELEICGEAINGVEAIEQARELSPDVIIMDLAMPMVNGLDATKTILAATPSTSILILSQHHSPEMLSAAFKAGAKAYVTKSLVAHSLLVALESLLQENKLELEDVAGPPARKKIPSLGGEA